MSYFAPPHRSSTWAGRIRAVWTAGLLLLLGSASAQLNNDTSPTFSFKSRPDLHAPIIDFTILRPELVSPGYIFLAPYRNLDPGPYIYDNWGNLVWSGAGESGPKTSHTPRVCSYRGRDHLCFFEGEQHQGFARGHGVIMDQNYRVVRTVDSAGAGASSDMHEFRTTPYANGTTALMTVYQPRQYDLTSNPRFNVERGLGWVAEGVFQEVEIDTGRVLFEWRSLDHVDPGLSWTMPGTTDTSGDGLHETTPWDYFHINSIDKNTEGDYLISARHTSAIYKLSGQGGHIMWQMGGNAATIHTTNFVFSYQHHARWMSENATHTTLSFFDNGGNGYNSTGQFSHGWVVVIDHAAAIATMIKQFGAPEPEGGLLSTSQCNMQMLPNGGCHIGWGEHAYFSEHTADGSAVMYGKLADRVSNVMIYRSNKYNWTGTPETKPALWTYSRTGEKMVFYVSWNGATEVRSWNFYVADTAAGKYTLVGNARKAGFETVFYAPGAAQWAFAEALNVDGTVMRSSVIARTFQPSPGLAKYCHDRDCDRPVATDDNHQTAYNVSVSVADRFLSPNRGFDTQQYYAEVPGEETWEAKGSSAARAAVGGSTREAVLVAVGALIGFGVMTIGIVMHAQGYLQKLEPLADTISRQTGQWTDSVTHSAFGARVLGKYQRVRDREPETGVHRRSPSGYPP
ncbi:hypothetical protein LTR53_008829 [Teratosphaeriaceae sp. CCFEE 6253]|nr:hypothetical protein LTR53_008829 [Teratosphaeriaceae sp. CCFEE 6253]